MDIINKAFLELMIEGDAEGRGFQYPIPTYSITGEFDWTETENNRLLFEMTAKYGTPYFSNYVNSDMSPSDVRSMCCRLRLDLRELRKKSGGYFGSGESTGSIGVVTVNLPRIAYLSDSEEEFYSRLDKMMDVAARSLKTKRQVVTRFLDAGLYLYTKRYLGTFKNHFSTIGLIGMNEACLNAKWLRSDLSQSESQQFAGEVLLHMRERLVVFQEQYGDLYNLEATPAESTSFRLAKHDLNRYPDIVTAGSDGEAPYYTNSSHLPVDFSEDLFDALEIQEPLQKLYTSGTVFHVFLGERMPDWKSTASLVRKIAENYEIPYYTLSPTYSICRNHGYLSGEQVNCPYCDQPVETYSRITGYYRPVGNWNEGKVQEFSERKEYRVETVASGS
jgi:ribonucleoside-triphosphate reductase